jgi:hypothetical protein
MMLLSEFLEMKKLIKMNAGYRNYTNENSEKSVLVSG